MEKTLELRVKALLGPEMAALQRNLQQAGMLGTQAGRAGATAGRDIDTGFQRANRSAKDFNSTIQNTTKYLQLIKGVISAFLLYRGFTFLTGQAQQFTRTLVDVQHQVGLIQTQLSQTGKDHRLDITRNVMSTAAETGVAMESLAKTEYAIVSANIAVADSYDVLNLSAKAAVAGGLKDSELAFESALSQVNTFSISFEKAFDLQFQTLKRGIFNYEQYTTVVGTLSEAFASMGQDAETANASLAAISQVFTGKQVERGATGLRNAVLRISEAPEDFERLGVAITDSNGEFRNFIEIAEDLDTVLAGMSGSQRAATIKSLFPDERERRGIGAFLGELENAEQFFIEQQFAVDGLNDAYDVANDSLQTQANIFQQNLIPAMQPFVDMMGGLLGIFNATDEMLPGLNKNLLTTATIAAVVGSGVLMTGNRFPLSHKFAGPAFGPMGMGRMPTGLGYGVAGLMGATAFSAGFQPGRAGTGDYVGSGLGGAATGAMIGGVPGALIGGAVGVIAVALGDALGDKGGPVAVSFSEAFSEQLEMRAGGIAHAFAAALKMEVAGVIPAGEEEGLLTLKKQGATSGRYGTKEQREQLREILRRGGTVSFDDSMKVGNVTLGEGRGSTFTGAGDIDELDRTIDKSGFFLGGAGSKTARISLSREQRNAAIRESMADFMAFRSDLSNVAPVEAARFGVSEAEFTKTATDQAVMDIPSDLSAFGRAIASGMGLFAEALAEGRVEMEDLDQALAILGEGTLEQQRAFLEFIGVLESGSAEIERTFAVIAGEFSALFVGDANLAADVFEHLGAEGEKLANVFRSIGQTMHAFTLLKTLSETGITTTTPGTTSRMYTNQQAYDKAYQDANNFIGPWQEGGFDQYIAERMSHYASLTTTSPATSQFTSILSQLGLDPAAAGQMLMNRLVSDLGLVQGNFTTRDFVNALLAESQPEELIEPLKLGANDFADALFTMAEGVRHGFFDAQTGAPRFFDTMGYTADQLEMFAEEFKDLNRLVRQQALLEQLKGIADFAGVGDQGIQGAMDILRTEMVNSGKALFDLLSDPASLAELIAKMEFGDVTVDNRTTQTIVVRYERGPGGDMGDDIEQAQRIANLIVQEMRKT